MKPPKPAPTAETATLECWMPAPGMRIRKRDGSLLSDDGEEIEITPFFARLIAAGDIVPAGSKTA